MVATTEIVFLQVLVIVMPDGLVLLATALFALLDVTTEVALVSTPAPAILDTLEPLATLLSVRTDVTAKAPVWDLSPALVSLDGLVTLVTSPPVLETAVETEFAHLLESVRVLLAGLALIAPPLCLPVVLDVV